MRIGVIGCGVIASSHIESYLNLPDIEIKALCDIVPEKCRKLAEKYSLVASISSDYRELISSGLDAVSICTDHASHPQICRDALDAGVSVLCEKPLASNDAGLDEILQAVRKNPSTTFAGVFQNRFNPVLSAIKELVSRNAFGRMVTSGIACNCQRSNGYYQTAPWRGNWDTEGGSVMINQAIHYLDLLLWFCGNPKSVSAKFANLTHRGVIETEDCVAAAIEFESGALGSVSATCSSFMEWQNAIWISGTDGFIFLNNCRVADMKFRNPGMNSLFEELSAKDLSGGLKIGKSHYGNLHFAQISDFVSSMRSGSKPLVDAESAARTVRTVMAIYKSQREGRSIPLQP